jgi:Helix-turn-helix
MYPTAIEPQTPTVKRQAEGKNRVIPLGMGPVLRPDGTPWPSGLDPAPIWAQVERARDWPPSHTWKGRTAGAHPGPAADDSTLRGAAEYARQALATVYAGALESVPAHTVIERLLPLVEGVLDESFARGGLWNNHNHWYWWHRRLWAVDVIERTRSAEALGPLNIQERLCLVMQVARADEPTPVSERIAYLTRVFYEAVADGVLQVLNVPSASWPDVAVLLKLRRSRRRYVHIANAPLYQELREHIAAGEFTRSEGGTTFVATIETTALRAVARIDPARSAEIFCPDATALDQWEARMAERVSKMDDLTVDVLDIIFAVWIARARHPTDVVWLARDEFLLRRGLLPQKSGTGRRGGYKARWRQRIADEVALLSSMYLTVWEMPLSQGRGRRRKPVLFRGESRAIEVSSRAGLVGAGNVMTPYVWSFRPGPELAKFLLGPGRQVALLSAKALRYNPYTQIWEKRLTRYLAWQWRIRQRRGNYLGPFGVTTLLKAIRMSVEVKHPGRTETRFEKPLDTLYNDGVIVGWQYSNDRLPFPERTVQIEPPQDVMSHYAQMPRGPKQKALPPAERRPAAAAELERVRVGRGLTLLQLAEDLGVPATELSEVERGARRPSDRLRKRIAAWGACTPRAYLPPV